MRTVGSNTQERRVVKGYKTSQDRRARHMLFTGFARCRAAHRRSALRPRSRGGMYLTNAASTSARVRDRPPRPPRPPLAEPGLSPPAGDDSPGRDTKVVHFCLPEELGYDGVPGSQQAPETGTSGAVIMAFNNTLQESGLDLDSSSLSARRVNPDRRFEVCAPPLEPLLGARSWPFDGGHRLELLAAARKFCNARPRFATAVSRSVEGGLARCAQRLDFLQRP